MTKFEEEHIKFNNEYGNCKSAYYQKAVRHHFKNWHSEEEFQEMKESYWNQAESILSMLEEIKSLKSQLQQQALPVVPECVAEWIECVKWKNNNALALLDDDNMPDDVNEWLFFQRNDDNINLILRAWLDGFTVEKPQLFYLKNKLTTSYLILDTSTGCFEHWGSTEATGRYKSSFTKQEINSMETGSYELVTVEDGE